MSLLTKKCSICIKFDCGVKCECHCHHGQTPIIRQDHNPQSEGLLLANKSEDQAMEGISALFG